MFKSGGKRDRTDDLLLAKQALSQLSYAPGKKVLSAESQVLSSYSGLGTQDSALAVNRPRKIRTSDLVLIRDAL